MMGFQSRRYATVLAKVMLVLLIVGMALPVLAQDDTVTISTTDNVNLRSLPGTSGSALAVVPYGTTLTATAISTDGLWLAVEYDDEDGWLYVSYVEIEEGYLSQLTVDDEAVDSDEDDDDDDTDDADVDTDLEILLALWDSVNGTADSDDSSSSSTTTYDDVIITNPPSGQDLPDPVHLVWEPVEDAESYRIEVYSDQSEVTYSETYRTSGTTIDINTGGMPARAQGWGYWIEVSALDEDGDVIAFDRIWGRRVDGTGEVSQRSGRASFGRP